MNSIADRFDALVAAIRRYIQDNAMLVAALAALALAAYGFELFGLNLTIDEEIRAFLTERSHYLAHGRWGLYLLDRFLLPYPIIPFVPLFIALACHVSAILLLLQCWGVDAQAHRLAAGALGVAFPGVAYFHAFSLSNYAIGIGFLCSALSLCVFVRTAGRARLLAVVPAVLALSIYQAFAVVLAAAYLVWLISAGLRDSGREFGLRNFAAIGGVGGLSFAAYYLLNLISLALSGAVTTYVDALLTLEHLRAHPASAISRTLAMVRDVYSGSAAIYAIEVPLFAVVIALAVFGTMTVVMRSPLTAAQRLFVVLLLVFLLLSPFVVGLFTGGTIPVRFMIALPVVVAGLAALGMRVRSRNFRMIAGLCAGCCVFQFVVSINYLNSSSHLALQADRMLASQLIGRIEDVRAAAGAQEPKYLEVVGFRERPASLLMPKAETFGASFFEWDMGDAWRIISFLKTLGYYPNVRALPAAQRGLLLEMAGAMPRWPAQGSIALDGDIVIVKFGDYSSTQKKEICAATGRPEFCW